MDRLDYFDIKPAGMEAYLRNYGYHFSKKMYEWAVSMMKDRNKQPVKTMEQDEFKTLLANNGINVEFQGYDGPYVYAMAKADFFGSSLPNEMSVLKFVSDYLGDPDGYESVAFNRFYADTIAKGIAIIWEDVI